jgi:hypothetical protein
VIVIPRKPYLILKCSRIKSSRHLDTHPALPSTVPNTIVNNSIRKHLIDHSSVLARRQQYRSLST